MQRDLLDALRCPNVHVESWLVAMVYAAQGTDLQRADLSCPVCSATFHVEDGVAIFAEARDHVANEGRADSSDPDEIMRLAAQLGVTSGALPIALVGDYAAHGAGLGALVPVPQVHVNAPIHSPHAMPWTDTHPTASHIIVERGLPLGVGTLAAIAVDARHATGPFLESAARAVRVGGRVIAPADAPLPSALRELARDAREWVAEVAVAASGLIELRRRDPDAVR